MRAAPQAIHQSGRPETKVEEAPSRPVSATPTLPYRLEPARACHCPEHGANATGGQAQELRHARRPNRGPLAKNGPKYLHWALIEAATGAARHPAYRERYEHTMKRLGRQRGSKVARVEIARELATAIWHMLAEGEPFDPGRSPARALVASTTLD